MRYTRFVLMTLCTATMMVCLSCKTQRQVPSSDMSALGAYITAYVPEMIRSTDPVRVRFTRAVIADDRIGTPVDSRIYAIQPKVPGTATWEDSYTFRFVPDHKFTPTERYTLSLRLGQIFDDEDARTLDAHLGFTIRPVDLFISAGDPEITDDDDTKTYTIRGQVYTSETVLAAEVQKVLAFSYPEKLPAAEWTHDAAGTSHSFTLSRVPRGSAERALAISWDGKPVGALAKGSASVPIPAAGVFKVTSVSVHQEGSRQVRLVFSNPLDPAFQYKGMVSINGRDAGLDIRRQSTNMLSVFTGEEITGDFTMRIDGAIRDKAGKTLGEAEVFQLTFEDQPPRVEILGKGNIVPHSGSVTLPFRTMNLRAIDVEIFEVFESNVMQYLQYGELWSSGGYEAVGRIVGRDTITLGTLQPEPPRNQWQRYALDLSRYTTIRPGSIYEVRIGFHAEHSMTHCTDPATPITYDEENPAVRTLWHYYYNWEDYDYSYRRDPCRREYYTAENFARRNVLASNLGLSAKLGAQDVLHMSVHDLRTTSPLSGCMIKAYDFQQQPVGEGRTAEDGSLQITCSRKPAFVLADYRGEKGYLKVTDGLALNVSDFDVSGAAPAEKGLRGFIYAERDVWRPGDTMWLNFVLQSGETSPVGHPVTCKVFNPLGQKRYELTKNLSVGPVYHFPVPTDVADLTGNWRAEILVGGVKFNKTLKVETIKPNRLKIAIDNDGAVKAWQRETVMPVSVNWLHGAPAGGLDARVELALSPATTRFAGYSVYTFDDPARATGTTSTTIFDGKLDGDGKARVVIVHDPSQLYPGKMNAHVKTRVFEKSGDFSIDQFSAEWQPYSAYAGLSIPDNRWGFKQLEEGKENTIALAAISADGKPLGDRTLVAGVYQADWRWWWNDSRYELGQYNSAQHLGAFQMDTVTTAADGLTRFSFTPPGYGLYLIRVCDTQSGHCSGDFAYAGYFYGDEDGRTAVAKLSLSSDKQQYTTGEEVVLTVPSSAGSLVVVSLEDDHGIARKEYLKADGDITRFRFTATKSMAPNIYAHVTLIQPHANENDLPLRLYGVIPVKVEDPTTRLTPVISMPDALRPEQTYEIKVSEAQKREMAYTIAIVDEGLLDLTRFRTPDPWEHFYAKRALGVKSWDVYDHVLSAYGGPVERILAVGGDGSGINVQAINEVNRFKPVVKHLGPFVLKAGATATHSVTMPNYVGSVRAMVVASTTDAAYGSAQKAVPVKSPLMVLATLPRVLAPGEEIAIPVNVFAMEDNIRNVEVSIRSNDKLRITGSTKQSLSFHKQGDQIVTFHAEVLQSVGTAEVWIDAKSGSESASQHLQLAVRNPNPYITEVEEHMLNKGESWDTRITHIGMPGTNQATLEVSSLFPANLEERLGYLIRYPYGCLEQTVSSAFPQLFVGNLIDLSAQDRARIDQNIRMAIERVARHLNPAGGFAYWPGAHEINEWTHSYTGHFLMEAQRAGYTVDVRLLDHWKAFQVARSQAFDIRERSESDLLNQAYRLYTMALAGQPDLGAMNRLRIATLSDVSRVALSAAYAAAGQLSVADQMITSPVHVREYSVAGSNFGSAMRDRALLAETLIMIGAHDRALPIVKRIADDLGTSAWYSTQSTAFALIAMSRYAAIRTDQDLYFAYRAAGNDRTTVRQPKAVHRVVIDEGRPAGVSVENLSDGPLYIRLTRGGRPVEPIAAAVQQHISMRVAWLDMQGKAIDPARLAQGTDFVLSVTVTNPGTFAERLSEMALQTIFPSGWEIINQRMDLAGDVLKSSASTYQDIRDDRVQTFFNLHGRSTVNYRFALNAAYAGEFILPAIYCEAMYDGAVKAIVPGRRVEVIPATPSVVQASVPGRD